MYYFAKFQKEKAGGYSVVFPELPGCFSQGETINECKENATEALNAWLESNCDRDLNIPAPKVKKSKIFYPIKVDFNIAFVIALRRVRKSRQLSQAQMANILAISQQAYAKLENPTKSNPTLSTIQNISEMLDIEFELKVAS